MEVAASERGSQPTGVAGERRRVTVLFADLVGFSTLAEFMDPEELHALITDTLGELAALIEAREGRVEKFIGDAVMAVFGAPRAHEDDPERAVEVALEMIRAVQRRSGPTSEPPELRVGSTADWSWPAAWGTAHRPV